MNNARGLIDAQFRNYSSFASYRINFDRIKDYNGNFKLEARPKAHLGVCFVWKSGLDAGSGNAIKNYWNSVLPNSGHIKTTEGELSVSFVLPMDVNKVPLAVKSFQEITYKLSDTYGAEDPQMFYCQAGEPHTIALPEIQDE